MFGKKVKTNGDMIKKLFPQLKVDKGTHREGTYEYVFLWKDYPTVCLGTFSKKWWEESYETQEND